MMDITSVGCETVEPHKGSGEEGVGELCMLL